MLEIIPCNESEKEKISIIARLAEEIWREHYEPIHGKPKIDYMLEKFQSQTAITEQLRIGFLYYLLRNESGYIGYVGVYPDADCLFLSKIYIKSCYRGKGYGKQAIAFIENIARDKTLSCIDLCVAKDNTDSIKAYTNLGFQVIKSVKKDIGSGFFMDDYVMKKHVDN